MASEEPQGERGPWEPLFTFLARATCCLLGAEVVCPSHNRDAWEQRWAASLQVDRPQCLKRNCASETHRANDSVQGNTQDGTLAEARARL